MICWSNKVKTQDGSKPFEDFLRSSTDMDLSRMQWKKAFYDQKEKVEKIVDGVRLSNFWIPLNDDYYLINERGKKALVDGVYYYTTYGYTYNFHFQVGEKTHVIQAAGTNQKILMADGSWKSLFSLTIGFDYVIVRTTDTDLTGLYLGVVLETHRKKLLPHFAIHLQNSLGVQIEPGFVLSSNHSVSGDQ